MDEMSQSSVYDAVPSRSQTITLVEGTRDELEVPNQPIIPVIHGDGIGTDVGPAARRVLNADKNEANPTALILSGRILLQWLGWEDAANLVLDSVERTIASGKVTYDLERHIEGGETHTTTEFADEIVDSIQHFA